MMSLKVSYMIWQRSVGPVMVDLPAVLQCKVPIAGHVPSGMVVEIMVDARPCAAGIVGDITPHCGVSDEDKFAQEAAAVKRIKELLGGSSLAGVRHVVFKCWWC
mgnify:CR=1 FL=1